MFQPCLITAAPSLVPYIEPLGNFVPRLRRLRQLTGKNKKGSGDDEAMYFFMVQWDVNGF
jgi:hypothetical protein